jgi:hypothetical protein
MAREKSKERPLLLALPDDCLLAALHYCSADYQRSLFSVTRAHSRLHQAAAAALSSIAVQVTRQQQLDDMLLYLGTHSRHVRSIGLKGVPRLAVQFCQLPHNLQLSSLQLDGLMLQLQPGDGFQGVQGSAVDVAALKQLLLMSLISSCKLLDDDDQALAAALFQLPTGLEHLSICDISSSEGQFPTAVLPQLQQLTYLELSGMGLQGPGESSPALQPLQDPSG